MASSCFVASRGVGLAAGFEVGPFVTGRREQARFHNVNFSSIEADRTIVLVSSSSAAKYTCHRKKWRNSPRLCAIVQCGSGILRSVQRSRAGSVFHRRKEWRCARRMLSGFHEADTCKFFTRAVAANVGAPVGNSTQTYILNERDVVARELEDGNRDNIGSIPARDDRKESRTERRKFVGVHPFRGRFQVKLRKDKRARSLRFSSQEDAARAYDKAMYKLHGDEAQTNFRLTTEEKLEVRRMEWDDLLVYLQLQDSARTSPSRLGFPGVCYREEKQSWTANFRRDNQNYVGYFKSMAEAMKAYDLAAYKLQGRDALLTRPLSSAEKVDIMHKDWDSFTAKLGFRVRPPRRKRNIECRGVRLRPAGNFLASFAYKGHYSYLGTFDTKEKAAKAYDLFAFKLLGDNAQLNSELTHDEMEFLETMSTLSLRNHLASQADIAPRILPLGSRGARLVQGRWEVCIESFRKDRLYVFSASSEEEAVKLHDKAVYKLHNGMGQAYYDLTLEEREEVESLDWADFVSRFNLQQIPSYHGVNRLVSGLWQSFIRHGGAYLAIATFDSPDAAARASDLCEDKLQAGNAVLNFPLSEQQRRETDSLDWGALVQNIRAKQIQSPVTRELGPASGISSASVSNEKKSKLLLCQEQLLEQQMSRRAPKVGRQLVIANPNLAAQFSHFNRRADESPMLVEETMEGGNTPLLWQCPCGNLVLKAPIRLLGAVQVVCKLPGCTTKPLSPRRMPRKGRTATS